MRKNKQPKTFRDENGEECCYGTFVNSFVFSLICWIKLIGFIGLLWFSRCFAHFLKTGGWTWL